MNLFPSKKKNWEQIYRTMEGQQDRSTKTAVLSLDPSVVSTFLVDDLKAGAENELHAMTIDIGGFGIDLCRILIGNKYKTMCAGLEYSNDRKTLEQFMQALNVPFVFASADGKMRSYVRILSKAGRPTTEMNETAWKVNDSVVKELDRRKSRVIGGMKANEILIVGGSAPAGVPDTVYYDWISAAKEKAVRTVLFAEGKLLREAMHAKPTAVVISRAAMEGYLRREVTTDTLGAEAKKIAENGIEIVCVYDEDFNIRIVYDGRIFGAKVGKGIPMNRPGAEPSIVAGVVMAMVRGKAPEALDYVTATLKGTLSKAGNAMCTGVEFEKFFEGNKK